MSCIYAMSDIHGCLAEFDAALRLVDLSGDNILVLLGDYIHGGGDSYGVLDRVMELERKYGPDKVVVLLGNHEDMALSGWWPIDADTCGDQYRDMETDDDRYFGWMQNLRRFYATERQIFCHAGVDETAGELWEWETDDVTYTEKYPAEIGPFCMDVIAGHVGTSEIAGDVRFHDIYFDGWSHYYLDGSVLDSGIIPVLKIDTETNQYYRVTETGGWPVLPYNDYA